MQTVTAQDLARLSWLEKRVEDLEREVRRLKEESVRILQSAREVTFRAS